MSVKVVLAVAEMQLDEGSPMTSVVGRFLEVAQVNEAGFASGAGNKIDHKLERTLVSAT